MPLRRLFIGVGGAEESGFFERSGDDLEPDWQVPWREAAGDGDGRKACQVEGIGKIRTKVLFIRVHGIESFGRPGHGRCCKQID